MSSAAVDFATLALGREVGSGGQGRVYEVLGRPELVYKAYHDPSTVNVTALNELISVPTAGPPEVWAKVDQATAWILARVEHHGRIVGVLMRRVPDAFTAVLGGSVMLREAQYLLFPPKPAWSGIGPVSAEQRLLLARLAVALFSDLHQMNVIVGDVSGKNLLWTLTPSPGVLLLDCDALRKSGSHPPTHQLHTPDWDDPHTPTGHASLDSDRYKLSLLVGRILARDAYIRPDKHALEPVSGIHEPMRSQVARVFQQAAAGPGTRPNAHQWKDALSERPTIPVTKTTGARPKSGDGVTELAADPDTRPIIRMK